MAKIPKKPEEVFPELTADYRKAFGDDLISILLYGSGASGHYVVGKSDMNFLILVTPQGMDRLDAAFTVVEKWKKRRVAVPLIMTREDLSCSLDAYPVEILNMSVHHVLVFGEDVLEGLTIRRDCLRLQLERELRGKLLLLRQGFMGTGGNVKRVRNLIRVSLKAFLAAFNSLLYLKGIEIPRDRASLIAAAEEAFAIDRIIFDQCLEIHRGQDRYTERQISGIFKGYVGEIAKLCEKIDRMVL